ncbi:MAG: M20/M25/M40 family metallo-hydrolase [Lachnospiraceae bacterium]|nr:M20/M25/M40 family metallo-hydrolase [Lachnospiraceae bacterium]
MLKYAVDHRDDYIKEAKNEIDIKSMTCNEKAMADYFLDRFEKMGADEVFRDGAGNVVAIFKGTGEGPNILLNGHMDTVPEGNIEAWGPYDPYNAVVDEEGKLHGRGASDLKGGMAAMVVATEALVNEYIKKGNKFPGDLIFLGVVQEEPAEMFGMRYFFEKTMPEKGIKADLVYLAEPSSNRLVLGQRGKVELVVTTYGKCAHSSQPWQGISALELMSPIINAIYAEEGFDLSPDKTGIKCPITITTCDVFPGGTLSVVPDKCIISVDRRYKPGLTLDDLLNEFKALFAKCEEKNPDFRATVEPRYYEETAYTGYVEKVPKAHPAWQTDPENEFVKLSFEALEEIGQPTEEGYWLFGTDGGMTQAAYGIPTIGYSGALEGQAHQPQEWCDVEEMLKTFSGYIAMLCKIWGIDIELFK